MLLVNKCQTHPEIDKSKSIRIGKNTMFCGTLLQIIKEKKRKRLRFFRILDTTKVLDLVFQEVKTSTIDFCFRNASISIEQQTPALMDVDFLFKKLQDQLQKSATFATDFYNSCATAEDVICANKNAFSRESSLADYVLIHTIMKFGNMNGSNDINASDRLNSIRSKVSHVGDALQVFRD